MITAPVNHIIWSTRVTSQTQFFNIGNTRCIILNSFPINVIDSADFKCVHRVNGMCVVDPCVVDRSVGRSGHSVGPLVGRLVGR